MEHWTTDILRGSPAAFQRAAREYAEEYAAALVAAERERWIKALVPVFDATAGELPHALYALHQFCGPTVRNEPGPTA